MKYSHQIIGLFIAFVFQFKALSQDSLFIHNKTEFNSLIVLEFLREASALNKEIQNKIIKEFRRYDFSAKKYDCQYVFDFSIELDSCGRITTTNLLKPYSDKNLRKFGYKVENIIENSGFEMLNNVHLKDTSFAFTSSFLFSFQISCDPSEIIFFEEPKNPTGNKSIVVYVENNTIINTFNWFSTCYKSTPTQN